MSRRVETWDEYVIARDLLTICKYRERLFVVELYVNVRMTKSSYKLIYWDDVNNEQWAMIHVT